MINISMEDYNAIKDMESGIDNESISIDLALLKNELGPDFVISDSILEQIIAALTSGNNLMLTGPPGTGKTTLATAISKIATSKEPLLTTATADWTTFDTIGGYMPDVTSDKNNALIFEEGIILESLRKNTWLIIDEINRAPIDKAIGQLFTVLSGGDSYLSYRNKIGKRYEIKNDNKRSTDSIIYKTSQWRIIATMNEYDKMTLFEMSYAFLRRFSLIRIGLPNNYGTFVSNLCIKTSLETTVSTILTNIADSCEKGELREIGPSIFKSIINYYLSRKALADTIDEQLFVLEGLAQFLLPQFQGLDFDDIKPLWDIINAVELSAENKNYFTKMVKQITDITIV